MSEAEQPAAGQVEATGIAFRYQPESEAEVFGKVLDDGRPEHVPEKYWDPDAKAVRADLVMKQHRWLESKLGEKGAGVFGAPEKYEFRLPEGVEQAPIDPEDPLLVGFMEMAKAENWSQAHVDKVLGYYVQQIADASKAATQEQLQQLGKGAAVRVQNVQQYLTANLPPEQASALLGEVMTARGLEAVEALIAAAQPPRLDRDIDLPTVTAEDVAKMQFATDEQGNRLIVKDPAYRKKYEALRDQVYGTARRDASGRVMR